MARENVDLLLDSRSLEPERLLAAVTRSALAEVSSKRSVVCFKNVTASLVRCHF